MAKRGLSPHVKAMLVGGLAAFVVVAIAGGIGTVYLKSTGSLGRDEAPDRVVIVFSGPANDGAQVAQLIAVVDGTGRDAVFVDPETSATVSGTGAATLRDAYPFGGAALVARAAAPKGTANASWIDVPSAAWAAMLDSARPTVTLPTSVEVFTEGRLVSFTAGEQRLAGRDAPALLNG
ncbi:MAG: hypothetical protein Q7W30_07700, partial [Coriobacteriia bacterium]|nr:hypothetical protein [Coriobacteriia bacterium]